MRTLLIPLADLHCGSNVGLMPKKVVDADGVTHIPSSVQKRILRQWNATQKEVLEMAGQHDKVVLVILGETIHGNDSENGIWTREKRTQADAFIEMVLPYAHVASSIFVLRASDWHVGPDGFVDDYIAAELGAHGRRSLLRAVLNIQGVRFALKHKGPKHGSRAWTRQNALRNFLLSEHANAVKRGKKAYDWYLWGHFHTFTPADVEEEYPDGWHTSHARILPAWTMVDEYALKHVNDLALAHVGMCVYSIDDGKVTEHRMYKKYDAVPEIRIGD